MTYEQLLYDTTNGVLTITLNRPETRNALNMALTAELVDAFQQADRDKSVRAVILTGTGKGFSSGADLQELAGAIAEVDITAMLRSGLNVITASMRSLEKPVVCAVNGVAAGAGASLALAADYRLASDQASFVFAAFANLGLIPDAGSTYLLPQLVGQAKALELALFADAKNRVSAADAHTFGIVNRVVAHDDLMTEAQVIAGKLAQMPTRAIGMTKRAIYRAADHDLADALDYEAQLQGAAYRTHDFREGVQAFLEKRTPVFKGE